jgi:hypothetical protein
MEIIDKNNQVLARKIYISSTTLGLSFFSDDQDFVQTGVWKYNKGKQLLAHKHNIIERKSDKTQEVIIVFSGSLKAIIFDEENLKVSEVYVYPKEVLVLLNGGHAYEILEDNTEVLEIKNGPYLGAEIDRKRI